MTKIEYGNGSVNYTVSGSDTEHTIDVLVIVTKFLQEFSGKWRRRVRRDLTDAALFYAECPEDTDIDLYRRILDHEGHMITPHLKIEEGRKKW